MALFTSQHHERPIRGAAQGRPRRGRLHSPIERLEGRQLLSTFTVTGVGDSINPFDGVETLREAITDARRSNQVSLINFNIPGPGVHTISPTMTLPELPQDVTVDASTQPGFTGGPHIELSGVLTTIGNPLNAPYTCAGPLVGLLADRRATIRGLAIDGFRDAGIVSLGGEVRIEGNYIGTDPTGTIARGNGFGVVVAHVDNTVVGNLISGNRLAGVSITINVIGPGPNHVDFPGTDTIQGNWIGTDVTLTRALGNGGPGVSCLDSVQNSITGNIISGNAGPGVSIASDGPTFPSSLNSVQGNSIGTDASGLAALGNGGPGVTILGSTGNKVGGTAAGTGNLISGNAGAGVRIDGDGASGNLVQGNRIGTDTRASRALPNSNDAVYISAPDNTVGGTAAGAGNVLSGNRGRGVRIDGVGNLVQGNRIGTDASGTRAVPDENGGMYLAGSDNTIGGTAAGAGNLISGNRYYGALDVGPRNLFQGNRIGTDASGTMALGNAGDGLTITGTFTLVGGTAAGAGNIIAYNAGAGVDVATPQAQGNVILSNSIFANAALGIDLNGDGVTINGPTNPGPGSNGGQNYPVLSSAFSNANGTLFYATGALHSAPRAMFRIELFASDAADPSGHGQGRTYLGSVTVTTDAAGNAPFSGTFSASAGAGHYLTATATSVYNYSFFGNTSEFSAAIPANPPGVTGSRPAIRVEAQARTTPLHRGTTHHLGRHAFPGGPVRG